MKTAFILAAGRGERLKPLTNTCPKALCVIHGIPLITHHIQKLVQAGIFRICINHAYLGGKIRQYLGNGQALGADIVYIPEPPGGLETGGGIVHALPLLGTDPFIVVNADIFTDYDFATLKIPTPYLGHLVLVPKNPKLQHSGDFGLTSNQRLCNTNKDYTFSGIAAYKPELFTDCTLGRYSVIPLIRRSTEAHRISGEIYSGVWFDIGSPERLLAVNAQLKSVRGQVFL
jgi:N-acetyl-alpha-D-muramate 1-phosphate uridylyltransferase